jgi:hypothetical protein
VVAVLNRKPENNIIISGNTSGFFRSKWEQRLSEMRARQVSAFLWDAGINNFGDASTGNETRQFTYVGYGNYFPIANDITNDGIRQNSRIQITSYPVGCNIYADARSRAMENVGGLQDNGLDAMFCDKCAPIDPPSA